MTYATDRPHDAQSLSPTSQRMLALRDAVFAEWERRVRADLPQAKDLKHPILIDTLPAFYDNIAEAVTLDYPRLVATSGTTVAAEHGGERARLTAYDHQALIGEYQIFRWVIFDVLYREGVPLVPDEVLAINASIDAGIKDAVNAFTLVHSALRERFAASLTHDLRAPLGAVATALELMQLAPELPRTRDLTAKALDNVHRMGAMIHELLDTMAFHGGHQLSLEMTHFDVCELVEEVRADAADALGPRIRTRGQPIPGWWDRSALKRALENMVGNAVKYGRPGTPVTIMVDAVHGRLLLTVHNEGDPIPPEEQEGIFQMYVRAEAARGNAGHGWGIGLPYVRAVAESHGGSIALESTAERGTTFVIDIPVDCRDFKGAPTIA